MTDVVRGASRSAGLPAAVPQVRGKVMARLVALAGAALMIAAIVVATVVRPSTPGASIPASDIARAHVLWLADEHTSSSRVSVPAAHLQWLGGEKTSYAASEASNASAGWQTYQTFRLEEEGYER